jgi:hypothetical protein
MTPWDEIRQRAVLCGWATATVPKSMSPVRDKGIHTLTRTREWP